MRSSLITLSFAVGCGSVHSNPDAQVDTQVDTPGSTTTLTVTTFRPSGPVNSQLVAVQDGAGPWTVVSGTAGVYTATLHSDHFGFMVACTGDLFSDVFITYAAVSDGTSWFVGDCNLPTATVATISGSVTGAATTNPTRVINGFDSVDVAAGVTAYSLPTSPGATR